MFTEQERVQIRDILKQQPPDALACEHLFVKSVGRWYLHAVGDEDTVHLSQQPPDAEAWLHTHPIPSYEPLVPSQLDMQVMQSSSLPHGIMNYCSHEDVINPTFWHTSIRSDEAGLLGRAYRWGDYGSDGKGDCYAFVSDWQRIYRNRELIRVPRDAYLKDSTYYTSNAHNAGFAVVTDNTLQIGDVLVMKIGHQGEHGGIFVGNGLMAHHPIGGVSRIEPVSRYMPHAVAVLRDTMG